MGFLSWMYKKGKKEIKDLSDEIKTDAKVVGNKSFKGIRKGAKIGARVVGYTLIAGVVKIIVQDDPYTMSWEIYKDKVKEIVDEEINKE